MTFSHYWAEHARTAVYMNLAELNAILSVAGGTGAGRHRPPDLQRALVRVERARDRRRRALARSKR
jgi:hypothetical protein